MEMAAFIHEHSTLVKDEDGTAYFVRIYGRERPDGTWEGWLEFHPTDERKSCCALSKRNHSPTVSPSNIGRLVWNRFTSKEPSHVRKDAVVGHA
jgi:hypothetical protein